MKSEQDITEDTQLYDNKASTTETQYVDEFGNPIDPSLIDEFGNYIGEDYQYVDEFGNPIDPNLIDEFGNYIGENTEDSTEPTDNQDVQTISAGAHQMDDKELLQGMVTFDYNNVPITDIVNSIILDAINKGASDIHFDPFDDGIKIRIRIDGQLNDYSIVPLFVKKNVITRIKIISGMNITESRTPQDGAIRTEIAGKTIDLRVSCLPTNMGEKIVIRIMDYSMSASGVDALDFSEKNLEKVKRMLDLPNGIILVTGATGSGKSTTVYSMLQRLNKEGTNLITVEDPIEMNIGGINQVQAAAEIGLTFAAVLRSILRQDPDVIMIGEIRDDETARIAVRASITGHLVLSTIHTNNSLNTIERLTDMSVERYLLGTALAGIVSQKLARRLCDKCKRLRPTNDYEKNMIKRVLHEDVEEIYEPVGCQYCSRGYRGRIAIQEVLLLNQAIKDAITKGVDKNELRNRVYSDNGTETMLQDGLRKVLEGKTSFDEIIKLIDLEDDLGTGSQLGLENQIDESAMANNQMSSSPITSFATTSGSPININITPEILNSLTNLANVAQNNDNANDEEIVIKPKKPSNPKKTKRIVEIDTDELLNSLEEQIEEEIVIKNSSDLPRKKTKKIVELDVDDIARHIEDNTEEEIVIKNSNNKARKKTKKVVELDIDDITEQTEDNTKEDLIIKNKPTTSTKIADNNDYELDAPSNLLNKFQNNLNKINKKKFVINTKKLLKEILNKNLDNNSLLPIINKYIQKINENSHLSLNDKETLIELFNNNFNITDDKTLNIITNYAINTIDNINSNVKDLNEDDINSILGLEDEEIENESIKANEALITVDINDENIDDNINIDLEPITSKETQLKRINLEPNNLEIDLIKEEKDADIINVDIEQNISDFPIELDIKEPDNEKEKIINVDIEENMNDYPLELDIKEPENETDYELLEDNKDEAVDFVEIT